MMLSFSPPAAPSRPPLDRQTGEGFRTIGGEEMYAIPNVARLKPFLVNVVSDSDLWMYVSSTGGLTAGRGNEDRSLFPYETDNKLHRAGGITGPFTRLRVTCDGETTLWHPFAAETPATPVQRNLYKSPEGNRIVFEEFNPAIRLTFRYAWSSCREFGWVRTATLHSSGRVPMQVDVLDGVINLLPAGAELSVQQKFGCLIDAYTAAELDRQTGLAVYSMTSRITDKAEPAESLFANIAYTVGLRPEAILLSTDQLDAFFAGETLRSESGLTGRRGAYLIHHSLSLKPDAPVSWSIVLDAGRDQEQVSQVQHRLNSENRAVVPEQLDAALRAATQRLTGIVAASDGLQYTGERHVSAHHFANVLFNSMRGGTFPHQYALPADDFRSFVSTRNTSAAVRHADLLARLPETVTIQRLLAMSQETGDADLIRLSLEYLPLTFGRRHGDPSRPWNRFDIRVQNADGTPALAYQGNWRDVFQNWEALCTSYPGFLQNIIAKFLNASTIDGFNVYRITQAGIDWETPEPNDPWANIGYWGDHQIVYLLRLLETSTQYQGGTLARLLPARIFAYANVPYRLKPYADLLKTPRDTIVFDAAMNRAIEDDLAEFGTDARLLRDSSGEVVHVTLLEKLLVPALAKLSNLVAGAGIWMNTQRPEWNDANNALVGNGISMVTLCYLRRYARFCIDLLTAAGSAEVSVEVVDWMRQVEQTLRSTDATVATDAMGRKQLLDALAGAFDAYRAKVYAGRSGKTAALAYAEARKLFTAALEHLDAAVRSNRREDGLYHAYNLLKLSADQRAIEIGRLDEMLEGQVAVLSAGVLDAADSLRVIETLFRSRLWRADQHSFMLYPMRTLPSFMGRNAVSNDAAGNPLVAALLEASDTTVIQRDAQGQLRFNSQFAKCDDLAIALDRLANSDRWAPLVHEHRETVLAVYEQVFQHHRFTGRSGTMYGYEGIGCIYWHMVSKLLLAVMETHQHAIATGESLTLIDGLARSYYRVRSGLSFNKTAVEYGAFPTDPYSHTPLHAGAQQPGMTGQVKEEILARLGELGVRVEAGELSFKPRMLREVEFTTQPGQWQYVDVNGNARSMDLPAGSLAFTLAQTPVIYCLADGKPSLTIHLAGGSTSTGTNFKLDAATVATLFSRDGSIDRIEVKLNASGLYSA